jgi:hypothetical protein
MRCNLRHPVSPHFSLSPGHKAELIIRVCVCVWIWHSSVEGSTNASKKPSKNFQKHGLIVCASDCERARRTRLGEGMFNVVSCLQVDDARTRSYRVPSAKIR